MNSNNEDAKKMDVILDKDLDNVSGGFESLSYKNNEKIRNMWGTYAIHEDDNGYYSHPKFNNYRPVTVQPVLGRVKFQA